MKSILERIAWLTRRWNIQFHLLDIYLHDHDGTWGINIAEFRVNFTQYSLFRFECRLPNKTHVQKFVVDSWDLLYMSQFLWKRRNDLADRQMWSRNLTLSERIQLYILDKIM
jgi:hypothetical protein